MRLIVGPRIARGLPLALTLLLVAISARSANDFEHPGFASGAMRPKSVMILPPRSAIIRARLTDSTELIKETALLERSCAESIAAALDRLGYHGDAASLDPAKLRVDRELLDLVTTLQDRVDDLLGVAVSKPRDVRAGRFTIGEEVLPLAARTKAEGFVIVQAQAVIPSRGRRTLSALFSVLGGAPPMPPTNSTRGIAVLIDARTGDLAWLTGAAVGGAVAKEPAAVGARLAQALMKSYPAAGVIHEQKKRKGSGDGEPPSVPQVAGAETDDAEAVLAAFESAAGASEAGPVPGPVPGPAEEPAATPPPIEDVPDHQDFQGESGGPVSAASPSPSADASVAAPVAPAITPPTAAELAAIRALWDAPEQARPTPTRQVVLQMLDGGPGLVVRNMSDPTVRVSVNLGGWLALDPGERHAFEVGKGSHRILVTDAQGVEVARIACLVGGASVCNAEIWPKL